jgi:hypothetical protein
LKYCFVCHRLPLFIAIWLICFDFLFSLYQIATTFPCPFLNVRCQFWCQFLQWFSFPAPPLLLGVGVDSDGYGLAALVLIRRFLPLDLALNQSVACAPGTTATGRRYPHTSKDKGTPDSRPCLLLT